MDPRKCRDCDVEFVPRASYEVRCFQCYLRVKGRQPSGSSVAATSGEPLVNPHANPPAMRGLSPHALASLDAPVKFPFRNAGAVISFGKYKGRTFQDVFENEKGYVVWALKQESPTSQLQEFVGYAKSQSQSGDIPRTPIQGDVNDEPARSRTPPRRPAILGQASHSLASPVKTRGSGKGGNHTIASVGVAAIVFSFGKHKGATFQSVLDGDKGYVAWALKQQGTSGQLSQFIEFAKEQLTGKPSISPILGCRMDWDQSHTAPRAGDISGPLTSAPPNDPDTVDAWMLAHGKHRGKTFSEAYEQNPECVSWVCSLPEASGQMAAFKKYVKARESAECQRLADVEVEEEKGAPDQRSEETKRCLLADNEGSEDEIQLQEEPQHKMEDLQNEKHASLADGPDLSVCFPSASTATAAILKASWVAPGTNVHFMSTMGDQVYTFTYSKLQPSYWYCSCPSWKFQKLDPRSRTCKHLAGLNLENDLKKD